ncbi:hypothetical protein VW35_08955 [Devosia soli]|uniref:Multidrug resistance protein MdtA-like C-terminal permuted SH3 domain-containing protein n=2 Tax=Devosia soli TaxID=361041 RepID=A0A0F5L9W8_9HYPH|nr:hypothetical protein VW35_08955 [Devosia soli]
MALRAIVNDGAESHVLVLENGKATNRQVTFSDWPAYRVIVTEGIQEGDASVVDPTGIADCQSVVAQWHGLWPQHRLSLTSGQTIHAC